MKSRGRLECGGSTEVEEHHLLLVNTFSMTRSAGRYADPRIRYVRSPTSGGWEIRGLSKGMPRCPASLPSLSNPIAA